MRAATVTPHQRADKLKADDEEKKDNAEKFARAPAREPALDPRENRTAQQDVERGESEQDNRRPQKDARIRKPCAHCDSHEPQTSEGRGGVERAVHEAYEKIFTVGERKAQQVRRIEVFRERRGHHGKKLPEQ